MVSSMDEILFLLFWYRTSNTYEVLSTPEYIGYYLALIMVQIFNPNKRPSNNNEMICMKQFCVHRTPEYILRAWHVQYGGVIRSSTSINIISTVRYSIVLYNNLYNAWLVQSFSPPKTKKTTCYSLLGYGPS